MKPKLYKFIRIYDTMILIILSTTNCIQSRKFLYSVISTTTTIWQKLTAKTVLTHML